MKNVHQRYEMRRTIIQQHTAHACEMKMFSRDISSPWQQLGIGKALLILQLHFAFARISYPFINSLQSRS